jgi:hypothetical protein
MANENKAAAIANDKEGYLYLHQEEKKSLKKFFCVSTIEELSYS